MNQAVTEQVVEGIDAVVVRGPDFTAALARQGATLLSWRVPLRGEPFDVLDGYRNLAELQSQDGARNAVMAPFVNRVAKGRYTFDGVQHDLFAGRPPDQALIYHGFLRRMALDIAGAQIDQGRASVAFSRTVTRGEVPGYPFDLEVGVRYIIAATSIELSITGTNPGSSAAPFAAGWHPYFRLAREAIDELELALPAGRIVRVDPDSMIPLAGPAAYAEVQSNTDFRGGRRLGGARLDATFVLDELPVTVLHDARRDVALRVTQDRGFMHVYTGDTLQRDRRRSIALEPVETMADALNRPDCRAGITLGPGEGRTFSCRVELIS